MTQWMARHDKTLLSLLDDAKIKQDDEDYKTTLASLDGEMEFIVNIYCAPKQQFNPIYFKDLMKECWNVGSKVATKLYKALDTWRTEVESVVQDAPEEEVNYTGRSRGSSVGSYSESELDDSSELYV